MPLWRCISCWKWRCSICYPSLPEGIMELGGFPRQSYDSFPNCAALGNLVLLQVNFVPSNPSSQVSHMAENWFNQTWQLLFAGFFYLRSLWILGIDVTHFSLVIVASLLAKNADHSSHEFGGEPDQFATLRGVIGSPKRFWSFLKIQNDTNIIQVWFKHI